MMNCRACRSFELSQPSTRPFAHPSCSWTRLIRGHSRRPSKMRRFSASKQRMLLLPPQLVPLLPPLLGQSRIPPDLAPCIIVISVEELDTPVDLGDEELYLFLC